MHVTGRTFSPSPRWHFHCDGSHRCISDVFCRVDVCMVGMTAGDAGKACLRQPVLACDMLASMALLAGVARVHGLKDAPRPREFVLDERTQLTQALVGKMPIEAALLRH